MIRGLGRRYYDRILALFLAASLAPLLALSGVLMSLAYSALERATDESGRAAAAAFAGRVEDLVGRAGTALRSLAADRELAALLASPLPPSPEAASGAQRLLARAAPRGGDFELIALGPMPGRDFATTDLAPDLRTSSRASWGILRRAAEPGAGLVVAARRRNAAGGEAEALAAALALRADDGEIRGFLVAEIHRAALVRAAGGGRGLLSAEAELLDPSGLVAFDLSDPAREGSFADELAPREGERAYEARGGGLVARTYLAAGLLEDLAAAMRTASLAGMAACAAAAAALALVASRIVTGPVLLLSASMARVEAGDLSARVSLRSGDELGRLGESFNAMAARLESLVRETVEGQELLREAELSALAAQMDPHFLYNSLNSIRSLAKLGRDEEIARAASSLGRLLRASVESRSGSSTLGASMKLVRDYLDIERIRFGERFRVTWDVDPRLEACPLPPLVLEPLVENALTHGLERRSGGGALRVEGRVEGGAALVAVEDDGPGAPPELLASLRATLAAGTVPADGRHVGLANTNRRLRLRYGPGFGISVSAGPDGSGGFRAELRVPFGDDGKEGRCTAS